MAALDVFAKGVRLGPNGRWLATIVPTWDLRWSEIAAVEQSRTALTVTLVWHIRSTSGSIKFLAYKGRKLSAALAAITERRPMSA